MQDTNGGQESTGTWADYLAANLPVDPSSSGPRPYARFLARIVDYALFVLVIDLGLYVMRGAWNPFERWGLLAAAVWIPLAWIPFESLLLTSAATTPGRHLLGIRVEEPVGDPAKLSVSFRRSTRVWAEGLAAAIPGLSLFAAIRSGLMLSRAGITPWDARLGLHVRHDPPTRGRAVLSALGILTIVGISGATVAGSQAGWQVANDADRIVEEIGGWAEEEGSGVEVRRELDGSLYEGEEHRIAVTLEPGETWAAAVACDLDCLDIDLLLVSEAGDTLARDERTFEEASLFFEAHRSVDAELVIYMYACEFGPCSYAVRFLSLDPGLMGGTGTCFGVAPGVLVTARHVTGDRDSVFVRFGDATRLVARVDSQRFENDIALLRIVDEEHETLALADRDSHYPGASVFALGYPATDLLGRELKVTDGVISSLSGPDDRDGMMQTSTPIQPGSSGGPLIDPGGRAVGMVVATAVSEVFYYEVGELPQNVNWAVRSDVIAEVLETAGVPVPDDGRPPADRRTALERALAATCFVETN
jgi:uncharacterized RDD family membrane protein YckC